PSRLELKRRDGSLSEAPLAKVSFTTALYVSPVQMMPSCSHTGTPRIAFDGFLHFTSSTTSGSASLMRVRTRASVSPRQSPSSLILAWISCEGDSPSFPSFAPLFLFFMVLSPYSWSPPVPEVSLKSTRLAQERWRARDRHARRSRLFRSMPVRRFTEPRRRAHVGDICDGILQAA